MESRDNLVKAVMAYVGGPEGYKPSHKGDRMMLQRNVVLAACQFVEEMGEPYAYVYEVTDYLGQHEIMIATAGNRWQTIPPGWTERPLYR